MNLFGKEYLPPGIFLCDQLNENHRQYSSECIYFLPIVLILLLKPKYNVLRDLKLDYNERLIFYSLAQVVFY